MSEIIFGVCVKWVPYDFKAERPGMLLRGEDGLIFLVGHVNDGGGVCGCCMPKRSWVEQSDTLLCGGLDSMLSVGSA